MLQTNEDIVKLIIEPPTSTISAHDQWLITLNMALILDEIWYLRNHICYQDARVDVPKSIHTVQAKFLEYSKLLSVSPPAFPPSSSTTWAPPPLGWIKINVDAASSEYRVAMEVIGRNHLGEVIRAWGRCRSLCFPLQAKAAALQWAVELAS